MIVDPFNAESSGSFYPKRFKRSYRLQKEMLHTYCYDYYICGLRTKIAKLIRLCRRHMASWDLINIGTCSSLLPDGTKSLPEPMRHYSSCPQGNLTTNVYVIHSWNVSGNWAFDITASSHVNSELIHPPPHPEQTAEKLLTIISSAILCIKTGWFRYFSLKSVSWGVIDKISPLI